MCFRFLWFSGLGSPPFGATGRQQSIGILKDRSLRLRQRPHQAAQRRR